MRNRTSKGIHNLLLYRNHTAYILCFALLSLTIVMVSHQAHGAGADGRSVQDFLPPSFTASTDEPLPAAEAFAYQIRYVPQSQPKSETPAHRTAFIEINWDIQPGYYLYQDRFKASLSTSTKSDTTNVALGDIQYSKSPIIKDDPDFGEVPVFKGALDMKIPIFSQQDQSLVFRLNYMGCMEGVLCYPPMSLTQKIKVKGSTLEEANTEQISRFSTKPNIAKPNISSQLESALAQASNSWVAISFFGLGLLLAFTACVYPMIPILSSLILGKGPTLSRWHGFRLSMTYVQAVALTYAIAGMFGASIGENFATYLQKPWILGISALLFVCLALSMFGLFSLQLPSAWQDKIDKLSQSQRGGSTLGVFSMGILSALVISPCVAPPLVAALSYATATGDLIRGGIALYALGLGMSAPLLLIGIFGPNILPSSGAWMDRVKQVLGLMLMSVAIIIMARLLDAWITLTLWGIWWIMPGIYLGALETATTGITRIKKGAGLVMLIIGLSLMLGGLMGNENPFKPLENLKVRSVNTANQINENQTQVWTYVSNHEELQQRLSVSQAPRLVYFYADWCIECKVMAREIFDRGESATLLRRFNPIKIDVTEMSNHDRTLMKALNVFGPPAILFFDKNGQEVKASRLIGRQLQDDFINTATPLLEDQA